MVKIGFNRVFDNLYMLRIFDDEIRFFEALWSIPEGIMYNSYILDTGSDIVLFDTVKNSYRSVYMDYLGKVVDIGRIKYVVIHHMEPDHSGVLYELYRRNPDIVFIGHTMAKAMIKSFYGFSPENYMAVKDGEELDINGYRIKFIHLPWIHWPETIASYIYEYKLLLSCDAFGSYGLYSNLYVDELDEKDYRKYLWFMRKYLANVVGHYLEWVVKGIEKLGETGLDIRVIGPSHGLLWRNVDKVLGLYMDWSRGLGGEHYVVIYSSMYGFLEKVVKHVVEKLSDLGVEYSVYGFSDREYSSLSDIIGELLTAKGLIIATATYEASVFPYMRYVVETIFEKIPRNKKVLIISNYGWGPVAGRVLEKMFREKGFNVVNVVEFRAGQLDKYIDKINEAVEKLVK